MFRDRDNWRVRWSEAGKSRSKTFATKQDAALFEAQLKKGVSTIRTIEQERTTFAEWADKWFQVYVKVNKSESTWADDKAALDNWITPIIGHLLLQNVKFVHGEELKALMVAKGRKPKTVNNVLGVAKKVLSVAVSYELLASNPWAKVSRLNVPENDYDFWTKEESDKFLKRCREVDPEFADFVVVSLHCGLRLGETAAIRRSDVDFESGYLTISKTHNRKLKKDLLRTKNRKLGRVEMSKDVISIMKARMFLKPDQHIFTPSLTRNAWERLQLMCEKANVKKLGPHDLRHSCASQMAMAGVPLYKISKHLRHSNLNQTQRYAHLSRESMSGVTDVFSPQSVRNGLKNGQTNSVSS
jgi:integrase